MDLELVFKDGARGNCIKDDNLHKENLYSIVNKDGKYNVYVLNFENNSLTTLGKLFNEDYSHIRIGTIRNSFTANDSFDGSYGYDPHKGFVCTLPDGTKEVYYFIYRETQSATKIFSKEDQIVDFEQVFLYYGQYTFIPCYIVKHLDETKSLVKISLNDPEEGLKYLVSHASKIENTYKGSVSVVEENGTDQISYNYNFYTSKRSHVRNQDGQFVNTKSPISKNYNNLQNPETNEIHP